MSAVSSVPGSLRRERDISNVNSNSKRILATFVAVLLTLSTSTRRYLFPASHLARMSGRSISRTSQGAASW